MASVQGRARGLRKRKVETMSSCTVDEFISPCSEIIPLSVPIEILNLVGTCLWDVAAGMLGQGQATVAQLATLARALVADGVPQEALQAFASLGGDGKYSSNQERDLHRWLRNLWGFNLEPYPLPMWLQAFGLQAERIFLPGVYEGLGSQVILLAQASTPEAERDLVTVPLLLPHEILHCVQQAGPVQAGWYKQ